MTAQPFDDVQVRRYAAGSAYPVADDAETGPETARRPARARVIPLFGNRRQEQQAPDLQESADPELTLGERLAQEVRQTSEELADSDLAREPLTPYQAMTTVAPAQGEAASKIAWMAMTAAGLIRLAGVTIGWLIAQGFATRIRSGVAFTVILLATLLGWLASN